MGNYYRTSYHAARPSWRSGFNKLGSYIGIELEVESDGGYQEVLRLLPDFNARLKPITETDGSLSPSGVEIVFPPFLSSTMKKKTSVLAKSMEAIAPQLRYAGGAGMHLNVNTRGWSREDRGKLIAVINNLPRAYLEHIGGRTLTHYCNQYSGRYLQDYADLRSHAVAAQAASATRVELRFPVATADHDKFIDLLEFVEHVIAFSRKGWKGTATYFSNYQNMRDQFYTYMDKTPKRKRILEILVNGYT